MSKIDVGETCAMKMTVSADERVRRLGDFSSLFSLYDSLDPYPSSFLHRSLLALVVIQLGK
jgi:hypothetical protein